MHCMWKAKYNSWWNDHRKKANQAGAAEKSLRKNRKKGAGKTLKRNRKKAAGRI